MKKQIYSVSTYIILFFAASAAGWLWEVALYLIQDGMLYNRGFLYGPWLPVYGTGAVFISLLLKNRAQSALFTFLSAALLGTATELCIGWFLDHVWKRRYWDYTGLCLNINGYVCLWSFLGFGIAGTLWLRFFAPKFSHFWRKLPAHFQRTFLTILLILFLFDCAAALIFPNSGMNIIFG